MFNNIISWSLAHKAAVLIGAGIVTLWGAWSVATMQVDILPDINKPTVTVFAESPNMAAEDVERLILVPMESALAGTPGVDRIRGNASFAQATVAVEFAWGSDILRSRQLVQERLSQAALPQNVRPVLGPSTSLLGEIMWVGMSAGESGLSPMELRTLADSTVRPALLKVPGVASVLVMGGEVREWQVLLSAERMRREGVMIDDVRAALEGALVNRSGGIVVEGEREYAIRVMAAPQNVGELEEVAVMRRDDGRIVRVGDIARAVEGPSPVRGSATVHGEDGVIFRIIRQPDAETIAVTDGIDEAFAALEPSLPAGVALHKDLFRQESFIRAGLSNVERALLEGVILVVIVLTIFLMSARTTTITLTAIPLSVLATAIVFKLFGFSVNVMTLGGIAVAVGELVDDAIVDVENIFRRLRLWIAGGRWGEREEVVLSASREVRGSIVYATALVAVVFLPLLFLPGVEGRLLTALGAAYLVSLLASMIVSLTVTPVLSALLLTDRALSGHERETRFVEYLKRRIEPLVRWCVGRAGAMGAVALATVFLSVGLYALAGKRGIPPFNEGSMVVMVFLPQGTALEATRDFAANLEREIGAVEGVRGVASIAGRAVADPHGGSANSSEMQIAVEEGYERDRIFRDIQAVLERYPQADFSLGQPITHRVEMLLSGVRAPVVVKVFGEEPLAMERAAGVVMRELKKQEGIANVRIQQNSAVPELRIYLDRNRLAGYGLSTGEAASDLEMGLMGDTLGQVRLGGVPVSVVARYDAESRGALSSIRDLPLPFERAEALASIGDVRLEGGRVNQDREGGKRVLVVSANYQGGDVAGAVGRAREAIERERLPAGVTLSFEGDYKSQRESARNLALISLVGVVLIFALLFHAFRSVPLVLIVMTNIPATLLGGMIGVWLTGGSVNLAHLVGFISLAGIVSRNGIMLIGRCLSIIRSEGAPFAQETVVRATLDRVVPVLMTSLVTALALVPLIIASGEPGKEMLAPLAVVVFGGLVSSTAISLFLTPALFFRFGKKAAYQAQERKEGGF